MTHRKPGAVCGIERELAATRLACLVLRGGATAWLGHQRVAGRVPEGVSARGLTRRGELRPVRLRDFGRSCGGGEASHDRVLGEVAGRPVSGTDFAQHRILGGADGTREETAGMEVAAAR